MHICDGYMGGWMVFFWVLATVAIAALVWLVASSADRGRQRPDGHSSEEILKRRYARGEIDRETYRRMLEEVRA